MAYTFVGRDHELAVLDGIRQRAAVDGRRRLVVVSGEPGIGKTWFCERAAVDAERNGFDVVWGRCWSHGGAPPLWPWPSVQSQLTGPHAARLLAEDQGHGEVDPERFARFAAAADLLATARADRPTMIVLDDVHRADEGALLLTRLLAGVLDRLPLLVVLVRRSGEAANGPGADILLYPPPPSADRPPPGVPNPGPPYGGPPYPGPIPPAPPPPARPKRRWVLKTVLIVIAGLVAISIFANRGPVRAPASGDAADVTGTPAAGEVQEAGTLSALDLQPGDCYNTREAPRCRAPASRSAPSRPSRARRHTPTR